MKKHPCRCIDSIFSALQDPAYLLSPEGRILQINDIAHATVGGVRVGESIESLAGRIHWDNASAVLQDCFTGKKTTFELLRGENGWTVFELTCIPIQKDGVQVEACLIQLVNVVGETLMEERYHMLSRVFNSISEGVLTLDNNGCITGMNRSAARLLSVCEESVNLKHWEEVLPIEEERTRSLFWKAFEEKKQLELNADLHFTEGKGVPCSLSISPMLSEQGECRGFAVILKNRTAQIEMERHLIQMEKLNSLGKLVAGFAHELNNPLTSVIGFSQLLMAEVGDKTVHEEITAIHDHALRCKKIIDNLLAFARKNLPEKKAIFLNDVIVSTVNLLGYQLKREGINICLHLEEDLPEIKVDPVQVQQVLVNLIENSRYELSRNREDGEIIVSTYKTPDQAVIRVRDNGPGIAASEIGKVFDPFYTTKPVGEGTGLGLSLSFGIMQQQGGALRVENLPSKGVEFEMSFPIPGKRSHLFDEPGQSKKQRPKPMRDGVTS
ncbi:MAG: PAS domain-containing protein [Planctomycetes bacterium]|nr:PAS domain-containing protein [Planctomycetota bacterium]